MMKKKLELKVVGRYVCEKEGSDVCGCSGMCEWCNEFLRVIEVEVKGKKIDLCEECYGDVVKGKNGKEWKKFLVEVMEV